MNIDWKTSQERIKGNFFNHVAHWWFPEARGFCWMLFFVSFILSDVVAKSGWQSWLVAILMIVCFLWGLYMLGVLITLWLPGHPPPEQQLRVKVIAYAVIGLLVLADICFCFT